MLKFTKIISAFTTVMMLANPITCFAVGSTTPDTNNEEEKFEIPDIVSVAEVERYGYIARDKEAEEDLNTFVFKNADGTNTMRVYSHPVKYIDETGKTNDISLDISPNFNGSFVSSQHPVQTLFEKRLSDGIRLSYNDIDITMIPEINDDITVSLTEDTKKVEYVADENTSYVYGLTYGGFKEDIVVSEYTGQTEYDFTIYTNGLALAENDGSYFLKGEDDVIKATIGDIIIFTADEKNNSTGSMSYVTIEEKEEYVVTIHLDNEYLQDENTAYPIRIDPTIEVNYSNNGSGAIEDVTINQYGSSNGSSGSLYIGKRDTYGIGRVLMKFPTLDTLLANKVHSSSNVIEANVEMRDLLCEDEAMYVVCYLFEGINENNDSWNETTTYYWNDINTDRYSMTLCTKRISYSNGISQENFHWYSFDITKAIKTWVDGSFSIQNGILFKTSSLVENGSTYINKTFASYNRNSYKPSLTIRFSYTVVRNDYFSKYDPNKFNSWTSNSPQLRMNCYGYSFAYILDDNANHPLYKQQPGEFSSYVNGNSYIEKMKNRIVNDGQSVGYTVTEVYLSPSTIPQLGTNSRLIALVTTPESYADLDKDYHFYMQHNDGTWSHKPGSTEVTNKSLDGERILTNENIYSYAREGIYTGAIKFFEITKSSLITPHSDCYSSQPVTTYANDVGNYLETSKYVTAGTISEKIHFPQDYDVYYFSATTSTYHFSTNCNSQDLNCVIYNRDGQKKFEDVNVGEVNLTVNLSPGSQYFIEIYNASNSCADYQLTIS